MLTKRNIRYNRLIDNSPRPYIDRGNMVSRASLERVGTDAKVCLSHVTIPTENLQPIWIAEYPNLSIEGISRYIPSHEFNTVVISATIDVVYSEECDVLFTTTHTFTTIMGYDILFKFVSIFLPSFTPAFRIVFTPVLDCNCMFLNEIRRTVFPTVTIVFTALDAEFSFSTQWLFPTSATKTVLNAFLSEACYVSVAHIDYRLHNILQCIYSLWSPIPPMTEVHRLPWRTES
jgi:hypothetical protein